MPTLRFKLADRIRLLPSFLNDGETVAQAAKLRLARCLLTAGDSVPMLVTPPPFEVTTSVNVWLNDEQFASLRAIASHHGVETSDAAAALLWADAQSEAPPPAPVVIADDENDELSIVLRASGKLTARAEQQRFYTTLTNFVQNARPHQVLFAEAGTGVGKTYAMLVACAKFKLANPGSCVILAFPTYSVLEQAFDAFQTLDTQTLGGVRPDGKIVLSQSSFVSLTTLEKWLDQAEDAELEARIRAWIAAGAPAPPDSSSQCRWLVRGLEHACAGLLMEEFESEFDVSQRLSNEDLGYLTYLQQKPSPESISSSGGLFFMTHAMLATMIMASRAAARRGLKQDGSAALQNLRTRWINTPKEERGKAVRLRELVNDSLAEMQVEDAAPLAFADLLVIDEAHLFEEWVSRIIGLDVSLWSLARDIKSLRSSHPRSVSAKTAEDIDSVFKFLQEIGQLADVESRSQQGFLQRMWDALEPLSNLGGGAARTPEGRRIKRVLSLRALLVRQRIGADTYLARLNWSPDRRWPRLQAGRQVVTQDLDWLWSQMAERSILVSATLYEQVPQVTPSTAAQNLGVRTASVVTMEPQHPNWTFAPVTLMRARLLHRVGGGYRFVRPTMSSPPTAEQITQRALWTQEIATYIHASWRSAPGGVAVLLTAYSDLEAISALLAEWNPEVPLITQRSRRSLEFTKREFIELRRSGLRPVMLMVGAGWTGFDVSIPDIPDALTDLVIPVMPFGINRSITQTYRESTRGIMTMAYAATMMARQGLGRLVRGPGTNHNRRIHFIDARWELESMRGLFSGIMRWLTTRYRVIRDI